MKMLIAAVILGSSIYSFASSQDFCVSKREIVPYTFFSKITLACNGVKIEETTALGRGLEERFEKKLKANGFKILLKVNGNRDYLISKKSLKDLGVSEICLASKSQSKDPFYLECSSTASLTLNSSEDSSLIQFANSYNYKILQRPHDKKGFFVLSR